MKRILITAAVLLVVCAAVWFGGAMVSGKAVYTVRTGPADKSALVMRVERPGLFVDVVPVADGPAPKEATFSPWPGTARRRAAAFFRGPMDLTVAEGAGPFDLSDLPKPAVGGEPAVVLPEGWRQMGHYAGRFEVIEGAPLAIAVPTGMAGAAEVPDKVRKLYAAAEAMFKRPPVREKIAVVAAPEPEQIARAVTELWVPDYAPDLRWLETGAARFYAVKLLDQTKLWNGGDKERWERQHAKEKDYALSIWLDASLRIQTSQKQSLIDLLAQAPGGQTSRQILDTINGMAGLGVSDHLDRMLKGREPLPVAG